MRVLGWARRRSIWIGGVLASILFAATGCARVLATRKHEPLHAEAPAGSWHVVKAGETPESIAAEARVPLEDFLEVNGLRRGDRLEPGQTVFVLSGRRETTTASTAPAAATGAAPLTWPLEAPKLTSAFGSRYGRAHEGIDLAAPIGTPIFAAASGEVIYAGDAVRGYGNMVVLAHAGELLTVYAHNSVVLVRQGDLVRAGQEIARVGQSGRATAPHLHFEVRIAKDPRDPLLYLPPLAPGAAPSRALTN